MECITSSARYKCTLVSQQSVLAASALPTSRPLCNKFPPGCLLIFLLLTLLSWISHCTNKNYSFPYTELARQKRTLRSHRCVNSLSRTCAGHTEQPYCWRWCLPVECQCDTTYLQLHNNNTNTLFISVWFINSFYRAMHFSAKRGIAIACRLSVRLYVCDVSELWSHRLEFFENNFTIS